MAATDNPFASTAPTAPSASVGAAPTAAQATSQGYTAVQAGSQGYDASTATAGQADATTRQVQANETVQNQLQGILSSGSPLLARAQQQALETANGRGLLNSSMAAEAGTAAMIDKAMPIASQDATTYGQAARDNQAVVNANSQFNAGQRTDVSKTNAGLLSNASAFTADSANKAALANQSATNQASQFTAGAANTASQFNAGQTNQLAMDQFDQGVKVSLANADSATRVQLQSMADTARSNLATLQNTYQTQLQGNAQASSAFQNTTAQISAIMQNPQMDQGAKQRAVDNLTGQLHNFLTMNDAVSGTKAANTLDWSLQSDMGGAPGSVTGSAYTQQNLQVNPALSSTHADLTPAMQYPNLPVGPQSDGSYVDQNHRWYPTQAQAAANVQPSTQAEQAPNMSSPY